MSERQLCGLNDIGRSIRNEILAIALSITATFRVSGITTMTYGRFCSVTVCTGDAVRWTF